MWDSICDDQLRGIDGAKDHAIASFAWWSSGRRINEFENSQHLSNTCRPCQPSTVSINLPCSEQTFGRSTASTEQHPQYPVTFHNISLLNLCMCTRAESPSLHVGGEDNTYRLTQSAQNSPALRIRSKVYKGHLLGWERFSLAVADTSDMICLFLGYSPLLLSLSLVHRFDH